jgi:ABC-type nitrate/sulfonate/bicarbonate transport system permease component
MTRAADAPVAVKPLRERRTFTRKQRVITTIVNLSLFLIAWETAPLLLGVPPLFLPRVSEILAEIPRMHAEGVLVENVLVSLRVYLLGMVLSIVLAVPLGFLLGGVKILDRIVSPYLWAIYTTPLIILMPLILLWVGINDPSTIPFIGTGVKMGVSRGLIGLFVGELFTSATGIGYIITLAYKVFNTPRMYAMVGMFVAFSVAMVGASQYIERKLSAWRTVPTV